MTRNSLLHIKNYERTCPSLTDTKVRRTLNLSIVKLQLCYATPGWSPFHNRKLSENIESVQRRATGWILKTKTGVLHTTTAGIRTFTSLLRKRNPPHVPTLKTKSLRKQEAQNCSTMSGFGSEFWQASSRRLCKVKPAAHERNLLR